MADKPAKKEVAIPEWQKKHEPNQDTTTTQPVDAPSISSGQIETPVGSASSTDLLEQARIFLSEESIKNASRERKVAFLEKKGIKAENIEKLLEAEIQENNNTEDGANLRTIHDSNGKNTTIAQTTQPMPPPTVSSTTNPPRDVPPIITYPEFLLKPQKPPPLITLDRLAYAAYAFAGLSALTYGASRWIVQPMLETLTTARHELAETTLSDLEKLNEKLESRVSHVPYIASSLVLKKEQRHNDDAESIDSDPTELFHRDIGTQTSPTRSRPSSIFSNDDDKKPGDPTTHQSEQLRSLHATLSTLLSSTSTSFSTAHLKTTIDEFQTSINDIDNENNAFYTDYTYASIYGNYKSPTGGNDDKTKPKKSGQGQKTEVDKFKTEIRSFKGALLSSRTFPTAPRPPPVTATSIPGR